MREDAFRGEFRSRGAGINEVQDPLLSNYNQSQAGNNNINSLNYNYNNNNSSNDIDGTRRPSSFPTNPLKYIEQLAIFDDNNNNNNATKDTSPAARLARRKMMLRAIYGEFMCTFIFMTALFGAIANGEKRGWSEEFRFLTGAIVSGFMVVSFTLAFSDMSGANCNCAISFALWLTGGLSNRKTICYIIVQLLASICSAGVIQLTFTGANKDLFLAVSLQPAPGDDILKVFATEFFCTFILTYSAFAVVYEEAERNKRNQMKVQHIASDNDQGLTLYASTPQAKSGFAPFCIGFVVLALSFFGGSSGVAMNPVRMLGPAIFSGAWDYFYVYTIAEFVGAGVAAVMVTYIHPYGLDQASSPQQEVLDANRKSERRMSEKIIQAKGPDIQ